MFRFGVMSSFDMASILKASTQTKREDVAPVTPTMVSYDGRPLGDRLLLPPLPPSLLVDSSTASAREQQQHKSPTLTELQMLLGIGGESSVLFSSSVSEQSRRPGLRTIFFFFL